MEYFRFLKQFCSQFTGLCLLDPAIKDKLTHKALVGTSICSVSRLQLHRLVGGGHLAHLWNGSLNGSVSIVAGCLNGHEACNESLGHFG